MSTFHPLRPFQALHPLQPLCAEVLRDGEVERAGVERRGGEAEADLAGVVRVDGAEEAAPTRALDRHGPGVEAAEAAEEPVGGRERGGDADGGAPAGLPGVAGAV